MKSLVTGGCGFIGSHIVDELLKNDFEVIVIDNESAICHNQFYYNSSPKVKYYKYDISDYDLIKPLFDDVDYVFHLAAEARIQPSLINPILTVKTNVLGTASILQASKESGVKRVIYSSTSSAYGRKHYQKFEERINGFQAWEPTDLSKYFDWSGLTEDMEDECLTPYSVAKTSGEKLCRMYTKLFGLETITLRYFNVYGPREPTKGQYAPVIGLFLRQHSAGEPLTIVPTGEQRRDFTHISDVVEANMKCISDSLDKECFGEIFNIGTSRNYSIKEIASMISDKTVFIGERNGEAKVTLANCEKAKKFLNWESSVKVENYIKDELEKRNLNK